MGDFLLGIAAELNRLWPCFPSEIADVIRNKKKFYRIIAKWIRICANDLYNNQGASLVITGERQPVWIHILTHAINAALNNIGKTVHIVTDSSKPKGIEQYSNLVQALRKKNTIKNLIVIGGNPVYTAPIDYNLVPLFNKSTK